MMFASIRSREIPWRVGQKVEAYPVTIDGEPGTVVLRDYSQSNPVNTLLDHFRNIDGGRGEYREWLKDLDANPEFWRRQRISVLGNPALVGYTTDEIEHAKKVLSRLPRLQQSAAIEELIEMED